VKKIIIRNPHNNEYETWAKIYKAYLDFYQTSLTSDELKKVWSWIFEANQELLCYLGEMDNEIGGLAHFRRFVRPIKACSGVFLDNLFVLPEFRGHKVGYRLIEAVKLYAKENNLPLVRWITTHDNKEAISLYESVATKTTWMTYDIKIE